MGRAGLETLVLCGGGGRQEDQEDVWAAGRSEVQRGQLWPQRAQKALLPQGAKKGSPSGFPLPCVRREA